MGSVLLILLLMMISYAPMRLAVAHWQHPHPQAILTLGGPSSRELFTASFAQSHPELDIWVSTGVKNIQARQIFADAGIEAQRIHLDRRAIDTVTNFTTLVNDFERLDISHVYVITSDFHMRRASAIATIVLGSRGIAFTPVTIPTYYPQETVFRMTRDVMRSFLWLITGRTAASLHPSQRREKITPV